MHERLSFGVLADHPAKGWVGYKIVSGGWGERFSHAGVGGRVWRRGRAWVGGWVSARAAGDASI